MCSTLANNQFVQGIAYEKEVQKQELEHRTASYLPAFLPFAWSTSSFSPS
jgi:hypothetical protein